MDNVLYIFIFLSFVLSFLLFIKRKNEHPQLPPGSLGWPLIGETLQLYSQDPNIFFLERQKRYGDVFKTHILGYPCVMLASAEAAKFVLVSHAHLFKPTYPKGKEKMIGPSALFFHEGAYHGQLRKLVKSSMAPDSIKKLIPQIEALSVRTIETWVTGCVINTYNEMKKFSFNVGILSIFGQLDNATADQLSKNYQILEKGYNCFPINIPGTAYNKALKARRKLKQILCSIISDRKKKSEHEQGLLGHFMNFRNDKGKGLTEEQITDNVIGVLFAAKDTTATILTWILKFLHDNPTLLHLVEKEQRAVIGSTTEDRSLTWAHTRDMPLTNRIILESLRLASIISFVFREAVTDVEYEGFLIRKGWKVMPLFRNIHHNPDFFCDPQSFDPSRFQVSPKPNTFFPFGNGEHSCPGNELAKLEIFILLHHLVTMYRWQVEGTVGGIQHAPFPVPPQGLPIRVSKM